MRLWATLALPKLSAYSRYSEDISCKKGQGVGVGCRALQTQPTRGTLQPTVLQPTEGQTFLLPSQ